MGVGLRMFDKVSFIILSIFMLLITISSSQASSLTYSVDPCGATSITSKGSGGNAEWVYGNACINMSMNKNTYNPNILINDLNKNKTFKILLFGVDERDFLGNKTSYPFASMGLKSDVSKGYLVYNNSNVSIGYIISGNTIKTIGTFKGLPKTYTTGSDYWLKINYQKNAEDLVEWIPVQADGITQPLELDNLTAGQNLFMFQKMGLTTFSEFVIDPIYTANYTATPATRLILGDVDTFDDSDFPIVQDVTAGLSDNLTTTQYGVFKHNVSTPSFLWFKEQGVEDTSKIAAIGGTVSNLHIENSQADFGRILMSGGATLQNGDLISFYMKPKTNADKNKVVYLKDPSDSVTYGTFNTGNNSVNYTFAHVILDNIVTPITQLYVHDNTLTSGVDIDVDYITIETYNENGTAFSVRWSQTYDIAYSWFLMLRKETVGSHEVFVYGYDTSDDLAVSEFTNMTLSGTGYFFIPVDDLMDYETNTQGLSFTQLRVFPVTSANFSEIRLRAESNDSTVPTIIGCSISGVNFTCNQTATLTCNITDDSAVFAATYLINDLNYSASQGSGSSWEYIYNFTGFGTLNFNWTRATARDLIGNSNFTNLNFSFNYVCIESCNENWVADNITCLTNDTYLVGYTDQNACNTTVNLPANNGTYEFCDYCQEDLVQILGTCMDTNNQSVMYMDLNEFICCDVTNLPSDCSIQSYPFNDTTYQFCNFFPVELGNITCQNEPDFSIREKEYCLAYIPMNFSNESFKCISDVYKLSSGEILQVNPEYTEKTDSILTFGRDPDTREYFAPANQLVNFYYTQKNLDPENDYVLRLQCSSNQRILSSEKQFQLGYEDLDFIIFRSKWLVGNFSYIFYICAFIVLFFLLVAALLIFTPRLK